MKIFERLLKLIILLTTGIIFFLLGIALIFLTVREKIKGMLKKFLILYFIWLVFNFYLPRRPSINIGNDLITTGPKITAINAGNKQKIRGKTNLTGAFIPASSAR